MYCDNCGVNFCVARFYKLQERKCEPIVMTVPRKVSPDWLLLQTAKRLLVCLLNQWQLVELSKINVPVIHLFVCCNFSSVGPVPGRLVPRHSWTWPCPGGWGVVWGQERWSNPYLSQEWLRTRQKPWVQGGQKEYFGRQGEQELGELQPCEQVCRPNSIDREYLLDLINIDQTRSTLVSTLSIASKKEPIWLLLQLTLHEFLVCQHFFFFLIFFIFILF